MSASFEELQNRVAQAGLLKRTRLSYVLLGLCILLGFGVSLYALTLSDNVFFQLGNALFFAFFTVQAGMFGHDFSHQQVFDSNKINTFFGSLVWGLLCGLSQERWYHKHNAHHKYVNHIGLDPDIEIPFVFSKKQVPYLSGSAKKYIQPQQQIIFFLVLPFLYMSYVFWSFKYLFSERHLKNIFEGLLMVIHFGTLFGILFLTLSVQTALTFLIIAAGCAGYYMGIVFAPNHKGEDIKNTSESMQWTDQITLTRNLFPSTRLFIFLEG